MGKEEVGNQVVLFIYRIPKKNHDAIIQLGKQADELFKRQGALRLEIFQLNNGKTYEDMGFVNIAKTVSAAHDEEVWVEFYNPTEIATILMRFLVR